MLVGVMLLVAIVAGAAVAAYGLFLDKSGQAIAFATSGLLVLGVALLLAGLVMGMNALSAGRAGRLGRSLLMAFVGGVGMILASGALAGAAALALAVLF